MPSSTPTRPNSRSRTIEPAQLTRGGLSLPDSWLRGILAGAEGVFGTWLAVMVPVIAVYIATASSPDLGSASWLEAARLGTGIWAVAHGAQFVVNEATITLVPLGITLMAFFLTAAAIRRANLATWAGGAFVVGTYTAGAGLLVQFVGVPGAGRAILGAAVIASLSVAWGQRGRRPAAPNWYLESRRSLLSAWTNWLEVGSRAQIAKLVGITLRAAWAGAGRTLAGIAALATVGTVLALILGAPLILAVHSELHIDIVSAIALAGAQILLLPTLIIWGAAYLSGAGFALGEGTLYSPSEVLSAPLPALPILGALPNPENPSLPLLGFTFLIIGLVAGWFLHRRVSALSDGEPHLALSLAAALVTTALVVGTVTLAGALASGGFGPGRFASGVGPLLGSFAAATAWQIGLPMLAVVTAMNPVAQRLSRAGVAKIRGLIAREPASK